MSDVVVNFTPQNFTPRNKLHNLLLPINETYGCDNSMFFLGKSNTSFDYVRDKEFEYFSAGIIRMMPKFKENRIFGNLTIEGVHPSNISRVYLFGEQGGVGIFQEDLAFCSQFKLNKWISSSRHGKITISDNDNMANYLFAVSKKNLEKVTVSRVLNGKMFDNKISLKVVVELLQPINGKRKYESETFLNNVLMTPRLDNDLTYRLNESVDDYDSYAPGLLRTGGDKWIRPIYADILEGMMLQVNQGDQGKWKINDISKSNNGFFPEHSRHHLGVEVDLFFGDNKLNLDNGKSLDRIEDFLDKAKDYHGYVRDYLLTAPDSEESLFHKRFLNRCLGDHFISLTIERGTGSLIRNAGKHKDHLHLMFHQVGVNQTAHKEEKRLPQDVSIEDFEFFLDNNENLIVILKDDKKADYVGKKITWRYHNKEGYRDPSLIVKHGTVDKNATRPIPVNKLKSVQMLRYIYIAVTNESYPLWCVEKKAFIEL